ncbi:MAG: hypothetical protein Q7J04_00310 [Microcella sp.]|nr:hypothetical protein [Microcella sp.]
MAASDAVLQFMASLLVFGVPIGLLVLHREHLVARATAATVAGLVGTGASLLVDLLLDSPSDAPAQVLDAAVAGAIAASVALLAARRVGPIGGAVFAGLWSMLVFQPVFAATVGSVPSLVQTVFGAVDFAAVLATHVAASASVIALTFLPRPLSVTYDPSGHPTLARALLSAACVIVGATAWMLGAERVLSEATGRTLGNAVAGMVIGAIVWSLTERIAGRPFRPHGLVMGAIVAWGAIGLGVPFLSPVALAATAVIGTAAGAAIVVRSESADGRERRIALGIIVAVSVGGVILALLADGFGLAATGSGALVLGQLGAVLAIGIGSLGSGLLCGGAALLVIVMVERRTAERTPTHERRETP